MLCRICCPKMYTADVKMPGFNQRTLDKTFLIIVFRIFIYIVFQQNIKAVDKIKDQEFSCASLYDMTIQIYNICKQWPQNNEAKMAHSMAITGIKTLNRTFLHSNIIKRKTFIPFSQHCTAV